MSVQSEFLKSLFDELTARGISEDVARENVTKFQNQLKKKAELDGSERIDSVLSKIPPASIAENIYNMLKAEDDSNAGARTEVVHIDTENDTMIKTVKEGSDSVNSTSEKDPDDADDNDCEGDDIAINANDSDDENEDETADAAESEEVLCETIEGSEESEEAEESKKPEKTSDESIDDDEIEVELEIEIGDDNDNDEGEDNTAEEGDGVVAEISDEDVTEPEDEDLGDTEVAEDTAEDFEEAEISEETEEAENSVEDSEDTESTEDTDNTESTKESEEDEEDDSDLKVFVLPGEDNSELDEYTPGSKRRVHRAGIHSAAQTPPGARKTVRRTSESIDIFEDETEKKNSWMFYVFTILIMPLACVVGAFVFAAFVAMWLALAVLSTLLIVGVFVIAAAGALVSICGLLFGLIELVGGSSAAAMFEIGLALIVGAAVMFVGILIYNVAIRLVPYLIKKLGTLLVFIFKTFVKALRRLKKLCDSI